MPAVIDPPVPGRTVPPVYDVPKGFERVDGVLVVKHPMGAESSLVASETHYRLRDYLERTRIGVAATADYSYQCFPHKPGQVRKPDVSVILCDPSTFAAPRVNCTLVPDLVVEVLSPSDEAFNVNERIRDFLLAGTKLIWVIDPESRFAAIYRPDRTGGQVWDGENLSGEGVLPGFSLPLAALLPRVLAADLPPAG